MIARLALDMLVISNTKQNPGTLARDFILEEQWN